MTEQEQVAQLKKTRALATGLLVVMSILFLVSRSMQARHPALGFVAAFAEAAMVGALADWFAVTALFRSPLGLPIPHTAIIPKNKDRIGDSLSDFLEHNFMTQEIIREELRPIDFAGAAAAWLVEPENSRAISRQIVRSLPALLKVVEDDDVQKFMHGQMQSTIDKMQFAPVFAELVSTLAAARHHQALFNYLIDMAASAFEHNKPYIRWKIHENSPKWMPKMVDEKVYERLLNAVQSTLNEMREEDSEWRMRFEKATASLIEQLRTSPVYEEKIGAVVRDVLAHPLFRNYTLDIWHGVRQRLVQDATSPDSQMVAKLDGVFRSFSKDLLGDRQVQSKLNQWIRITATETIVARREAIADLVARVIRKWDADTMSRKLELHVGKDLQYIRINGTLVGGLVGLLLHVVSLAL
ncbi:DUF445 domain-containing protein [Noviherbaspirillum galbum]|uniref:DUF445 domain-containing protein n=1 Tax=Noviherbaspirillum galbum TaxID=2709383 RepID=A0A6B3SQJ7_9BURK|nr:DUF445 domain-containing protein [Noviherbaspirillum galbum]NEX61585.1 DUF445 domain-containing protein [Noviherbaspirillum galbum]